MATTFNDAFAKAAGGKVDLTSALLNALLVNVTQLPRESTVWAKHSIDEHCYILDALFWSMQSDSMQPDSKKTFRNQSTQAYLNEDVLKTFEKLRDWAKSELPKVPTPATLLQSIFCKWERQQSDFLVVTDAIADRSIPPMVLQASLLLHVLDFPSFSDKCSISLLQTAKWARDYGTHGCLP